MYRSSPQKAGGGAEIPLGAATLVLVAHRERVLLADLQVEARRDFDAVEGAKTEPETGMMLPLLSMGMYQRLVD